MTTYFRDSGCLFETTAYPGWLHLQLFLGWPSVRVCIRAPASPSLL